MFRLSKKIEYAILALQYIASKNEELATAKEISDKLEIPYEFLSKSLQKLIKKGLLESHQGTKGGYQLSKSSDQISVDEVIRALEEKPGIVGCMDSNTNVPCGRIDFCTLKDPMAIIQHQINAIFKQTTIAQLAINSSK